MLILATAAFKVKSTYHRTKQKSTGQIVFERDRILPIKHVADWRYIRQLKQTQINRYVIHENTTIIDHDYRVRDQVIMDSKSAFKYETPFKGPYNFF